MKFAYVPAWRRRLLAAAALSLALHLSIAAWIAMSAPPHAPPAPLPLTLRLQDSSPAAGARPADALRRGGPPPAPRPTQAPHDPLPPAARQAATPAPPAGPPGPANPAPAAPGTGLTAMPGRYRVRLPPAALLTYSLTGTGHGTDAPDAGTATIAWQTDGDRYRLRTAGVPGTLTSAGASGDAGIVPLEAVETDARGVTASTRFDAEGQRIVFTGPGRSVPLNVGSQDRASVLMQLAGMGLAEPDQMHDVIEIFVGGAADAAVARFQVQGQEPVATGLGTTVSWHLVQLVRPGERRLELWLAPEHNWYPVQLRATDPDGSATTQVLQSIVPAPPLP